MTVPDPYNNRKSYSWIWGRKRGREGQGRGRDGENDGKRKEGRKGGEEEGKG